MMRGDRVKNIYCVIGGSGSGKDAIVDALITKKNYKKLRSYTTRSKRRGDEDCHTFIDGQGMAKFLDDFMFENGDKMVAHTFYDGNYYFCTESQLKDNDIYIVDQCGLKSLFMGYRGIKKIKVIYVTCPPDIARERMLQRGDSVEKVNDRLKIDEQVFDHTYLCDISDLILFSDINTTSQSVGLFEKFITECEDKTDD